MTAFVVAVVALAAGYVLGRWRPAHRASDWAAWNYCTSAWQLRRYRWPSQVIRTADLVWQLVGHPIESRRNIRAWKAAQQQRRGPAPQRDPDWAAKRAAEREEQP